MTTIRQDSRFRKQLGHKLDYCLNGITFRWPNSTLESHPRKDTHFFAPSPAMALDTGSPVASPAPVPLLPVFGSLRGRGPVGFRERCSRLLLRRTGAAQRRLCCRICSAAPVARDTSAGAGVRRLRPLFRGRRLPPPAVGQVLHPAGRGVAWCVALLRISAELRRQRTAPSARAAAPSRSDGCSRCVLPDPPAPPEAQHDATAPRPWATRAARSPARTGASRPFAAWTSCTCRRSPSRRSSAPPPSSGPRQRRARSTLQGCGSWSRSSRGRGRSGQGSR